MFKKTFQSALLVLAAVAITACATSGTSPQGQKTQLFEVHHDNGRTYVFDNFDLYMQAAQGGTPLYHRTRIGGGHEGQTLVFGLNSDQSKQTGDIDFIQMYDGEIDIAGEFYGEMRRDSRIYVFDRLEDMHANRSGNPLYFVNQIGAGPEGQTVYFVQNRDNSGQPADHLIEKFNQINN